MAVDYKRRAVVGLYLFWEDEYFSGKKLFTPWEISMEKRYFVKPA